MSLAVPDSPPRPGRVAVIGSGFSGLAAAIALRKHGIEDFTIFEKNAGLGGTWWHNRYPGAEVDLESHIYSFSFERYDWSRVYVDWRELLEYLEHVAGKWRITERIRFNQKVDSVVWDEASRTYAITTASGEVHSGFRTVISAVGFLNVPLLPPFARGETPFEGVQCHTSAWPEGLDMTGKRVGILGTGSSGVQIISAAADVASEVKIFQLEPNWILPKESRAFTEEERRRHRLGPVYWWKRFRLYAGYDLRQYWSSHARKDGRTNRKRAARSLDYLNRSLADRPDLLKLATPEFAFEARRTVLSDDYYDVIKRPHVHLIPHGAAKLSKKGVVDASGEEHELDIIIYATGFDAANYLASFKVTGERGADLHATWAGEPEALLGMMVPGFPNFFMMYGPNTNAVPLVTFYETQADFAASLTARMLKAGKRIIEVDRSAFRRFNDRLQARLAKTVWGSTSNYFRAGTGKIVSQWPFSATAYILATRIARWKWVRIR